jgi:hypothetical protein
LFWTSDRFIALSDSPTMTRIVGMSARRGKPVELRGRRSTSLANLRGKPSVFVGAFSNLWTLSLTRDLRYSFQQESDGSGEFVPAASLVVEAELALTAKPD